MKLAIVIVNYNTPAETVDCLESLKKCVSPKGLEVRTVLVDNGSRDDSVSVIFERFPEVDLLPLEDNTGFAGGNNVGIREAKTFDPDWYLLLNSDTEVPRSFLKEVMTALGGTKYQLFSPKIYFAKGFEYHKERYDEQELGRVIWYAGGILDRRNVYGTHRGVDEVDCGQYDEAGATDFATGAALFIKAEVIDKVGLLDEKFFLYLEDLEFCERARVRGYKVGYEPQISLWHKVSSSSGGIGSSLNDYFITRNRLLFGSRYLGWRTSLALYRESLKFWVSGTKYQKLAVKDFWIRNLGKGSYFTRNED